MTIVGCYTMHLYCKNENNCLDKNNEITDEYTGDNEEQCAKQARKTGWVLDLEELEAICPKCNKASQKGA